MEPQRAGEWVGVESRPDALVARFTHEVVLGGGAAPDVTDRLTALVAEAGRRPLLIDFTNVRSLSSLMLRGLTTLSRAANTADVRLALYNLRPDVREILEVTGLNVLLCLYGSESEAMQRTGAAGQ